MRIGDIPGEILDPIINQDKPPKFKDLLGIVQSRVGGPLESDIITSYNEGRATLAHVGVVIHARWQTWYKNNFYNSLVECKTAEKVYGLFLTYMTNRRKPEYLVFKKVVDDNGLADAKGNAFTPAVLKLIVQSQKIAAYQREHPPVAKTSYWTYEKDASLANSIDLGETKKAIAKRLGISYRRVLYRWKEISKYCIVLRTLEKDQKTQLLELMVAHIDLIKEHSFRQFIEKVSESRILREVPISYIPDLSRFVLNGHFRTWLEENGYTHLAGDFPKTTEISHNNHRAPPSTMAGAGVAASPVPAEAGTSLEDIIRSLIETADTSFIDQVYPYFPSI
ncbi:MAG: hypothetical protein MRY21_02485 [Simkaniaceae bacterium]|nr:hypothetical protein [Simkaniaceae bacterium]